MKARLFRTMATAAIGMMSIGLITVPTATAAAPSQGAGVGVIAVRAGGHVAMGVGSCGPAHRAVVHQGSTGASVRYLQCLLNQFPNLPHLAEDGIFGPRTAANVLTIKRALFGRASDTIVGPKTWRAILDQLACQCGGPA